MSQNDVLGVIYLAVLVEGIEFPSEWMVLASRSSLYTLPLLWRPKGLLERPAKNFGIKGCPQGLIWTLNFPRNWDPGRGSEGQMGDSVYFWTFEAAAKITF